MLYVSDEGHVVFHRETEPFGLHSRKRLTPNVYTHVAASFGFGKTAIFINGSLAGERTPVLSFTIFAHSLTFFFIAASLGCTRPVFRCQFEEC